jgi:hypothetical protein
MACRWSAGALHRIHDQPGTDSFAMGERSAELLGRLKDWMRRNNAVILAVVLVVIGVTLIGDGIGGLAS